MRSHRTKRTFLDLLPAVKIVVLLILFAFHSELFAQQIRKLDFSLSQLEKPLKYYLLELRSTTYLVSVERFGATGEYLTITGKLEAISKENTMAKVFSDGIYNDGSLYVTVVGDSVSGMVEVEESDLKSRRYNIRGAPGAVKLEEAPSPLLGSHCAMDQIYSASPTPVSRTRSADSEADVLSLNNSSIEDSVNEESETETAKETADEVSEEEQEQPKGLFGVQAVRSRNQSTDSINELDLLVAYTPKTLAAATSASNLEAYMRSVIAGANDIFERSQTHARIRLVGFHQLSEDESGIAIDDLVGITEIDRKWDDVHSVRETFGADIVALVEDDYLKERNGQELRPLCGLAWIPHPGVPSWAKKRAFLVFSALFSGEDKGACGEYALSHELGHVLGNNHDKKNAVGGAAYEYSYGHKAFVPRSGEKNLILATIMAYLDKEEWENGKRVKYFSNPNLSVQRQALGVQGQSNVALSINRVSSKVAAFQPRTLVNISGSVRDEAGGVGGVKIQVSENIVARTAANGTYSFLASIDTQFTITAQSDEGSFAPESILIDVKKDNIADRNFVMTKKASVVFSNSYKINIASVSSGFRLRGVKYFVNDDLIGLGDDIGEINITAPRESTHVIRPFHPDYGFSPSSFIIKNIKRDENIVFEASRGVDWITGYVWNQVGNPIASVLIDAAGALRDDSGELKATTTNFGYYRFVNAQQGVQYYLTPKYSGLHFFPPQASILMDQGLKRVDFLQLDGPGERIYGKVQDESGYGLSETTVSLYCSSRYGDFEIQNLLTDENGIFDYQGILKESVCSLSLSKEGYEFDQTGLNIVAGVTGEVKLSGKTVTVPVRGRIVDSSGVPIAGLVVNMGSESVATSEDGTFSVRAPASSIIEIVPASDKHYFNPPSYKITTNRGEISQIDFVATSYVTTTKQVSFVGKPIIVGGRDDKSPSIKVKINVMNPDGHKFHLTWQMRKLKLKTGTKKRYASWRTLAGLTASDISLERNKMKSGVYELRATLSDLEGKASVVYSKRTTLRISSKRSK